MRKFSTHGIEHNLDALENKDMPAYYYEMQDLGFNYRLSDLQAALGISQLAKVDELLNMSSKSNNGRLADAIWGLSMCDEVFETKFKQLLNETKQRLQKEFNEL